MDVVEMVLLIVVHRSQNVTKNKMQLQKLKRIIFLVINDSTYLFDIEILCYTVIIILNHIIPIYEANFNESESPPNLTKAFFLLLGVTKVLIDLIVTLYNSFKAFLIYYLLALGSTKKTYIIILFYHCVIVFHNFS